ncbi:MAG: HlyD family efflux transporter periplasmic adaptor subunit [Bacteroidetes bacterium]|uniref:HlyD family efflux transporter periplasmic adaptor subunit n=1 Tax=Candidatus Cryptobacteroides merdigallinarum TaxID=2840770 RepID=A0A9D9EIZ7_9BACT|nr:HlyD family efflux transporter periplasmic adaptor subunit [Candidatus Cryptobacteroides merdigallinarum]
MKAPDFDACGQINATEVTVSAENSGRLITLDIEEGDVLSRGTYVGCIDSVQTYLKKEELISRKASALVKKVDIKCQTEAQYARLENLETELRRFSDLLAKDAGTQKQVDDIESEIAVLKGQIAAAEQNYRQNNENIDRETGTIDVQIAQTEDMLAKCRIKSPIDGTVLTKYAEAGEMVTTGKPLFKVADMENLYVRAYFTTAQLSEVKLGDEVTVIPDNGTREPDRYTGKVTWISDEAEFTPKNIQTRDERADLVYAVKVAVRNDGRLKLGMYAYIVL